MKSSRTTPDGCFLLACFLYIKSRIKDFLSIDEVATYLQIAKSSVYKLTSSKELTVYKPNGKNIFILRSDLDNWIRRNLSYSNEEIERQANIIACHSEKDNKKKQYQKGVK